jgi:cytochrome c5
MNKTLCSLLFVFANASVYAATGEETYKTVCASCHSQGLAGSPKTGDAKAWNKLIKEGQVPLTADGYSGVRAMPPKGGRAELTLPEFAAAVVYMANQSGANWREPNEAMLKKINARLDKRNMIKK